ncbi:MAG: DUF4363 family protein [Eubacteriales bacterium]
MYFSSHFHPIHYEFITQDIEQIADTSLQDDKDTALTLSRQAEEKWQNHHAVLCTFMSHMQLEEIDRSLAALPAFIELGRRSGYSGRM